MADTAILMKGPTLPDAGGLYDLSGFNIHYAVTWPEVPATSSTYNVTANDSADLVSAIQTANRRVVVPAGSYTPSSGDLENFADNVDLVLDNSATINGGMQIVSASHVRVTGGRILNAGLNSWITASDNIILDNIYMESNVGLGYSGGVSSSLVALLNLSLDTSAQSATFSIFFNPDITLAADHYSDIIIANMLPWAGSGIGTGNTRFQYCDRLTIVDSFVRGNQDDGAGGTGLRFGLEVDQAYIGGTTFFGTMHMTYKGPSSEGAYYINDMKWEDCVRYVKNGDAAFIWGNTTGSEPAGGWGEVDTPANVYTDIPAQIGNAISVTPFSGTGIPNALTWDGTTIPDFSSYGADHS